MIISHGITGPHRSSETMQILLTMRKQTHTTLFSSFISEINAFSYLSIWLNIKAENSNKKKGRLSQSCHTHYPGSWKNGETKKT